MYEPCFVEKAQAVQKLLGENPNESCTQTSKLVLLDQFVKIDAEKFKNQTQVLPVDERIFEP